MDKAEERAREIVENHDRPSVTMIAQAIRDAVDEERAACFSIALNHPCGSSSTARFAAGGIAAAIRARSKEG